MYISLVRGGKNHEITYVNLVEAYRDDKGQKRSRVIERFGRLDVLEKDDPDYLEKLKAQYKDESDAKKKATTKKRLDAAANEIASGQAPNANANTPMPSLHYGHYPLQRIWKDDLQLDRKLNYLQQSCYKKAAFQINKSACFMACMKVMDPGSVRFAFDSKDDFLGDPAKDLTLDSLYETLSILKDNKDDLFKWINKRMDERFSPDRATLVFYDVTNAYFETMMTDAESDTPQDDFAERVQKAAEQMRDDGRLSEDCFDTSGLVIPDALPEAFWEEDANNRLKYLRMRGPSKEHRTDLPIVSIALVIDRNGFPMDFEVFSGNASEYKTMRPAIRKLQEKYHIKDAVVVADRGLNSVENLQMLKDLGLGFLVAQKVTNFPSKIEADMLDLTKYKPFSESDETAGKYRVINDWKKTGKDGRTINCMMVLTYNEKRRRRDDKILDIYAEIAEKKAASGASIGARKTGWASIAKLDGDTDRKVLGVDQAALTRKRKYSGFAAVVYDEAETELDKDGVAKRTLSGRDVACVYPHLNRIEDAFRVMKSNLGLRPMYVRTSDHIRGHITVCVLALLLCRLLQHRLNEQKTPLSINEICYALQSATVAPITLSKEQASFCLVGGLNRVRKDREQLTTAQIQQKLKDGEIKQTNMPDIMTAAGLKPLTRVMSLSELATALRVRFPTVENAIPELRQDLV